VPNNDEIKSGHFSINSIGVQFGEKKVSLKSRYCDDERLLSKTGIEYVFESSEDAAILGTKAAEKILGKDRDEIRVLIVVSQSQTRLLPGISYEIHRNLGLPSECLCLDLVQGCAGFVQGLILASKLVSPSRKVLLICADTYRNKIRPGDRSADAIFSDAASATLISSSRIVSIIGDLHFSDGNGIKHLHQPMDELGNKNFLHMSGSDVFLFTKRIVESQVRSLLATLNIKEEEVDLFIPHQASKLVISELAFKFRSVKKFINSVGVAGNTVSSSIPIALEENLNLLREGTTVLTGFGVGLACSTVVLKASKIE
jgi:3-oxoacyl-[acyl-carrier-protein] synthase-3